MTMSMKRCAVSLICLCLGSWACADSHPLDADVERLQAQLEAKNAEIAQSAETVQRLEGEVRSLMEANSALERRLSILELKEEPCEGLREARAEAARWRAGLEKAVEALNDQQLQLATEKKLAAANARSGASSSRAARDPEDRWVVVHEPYVTAGEDFVEVSGTLHNANSQAISGFLRLTVSLDGLEADSVSFPLEIPANADLEYGHLFESLNVGGGTVRVVGEWDKER